MLSAALAFLAGICLLFCCDRLPGSAMLAAVALALWPAWRLRRRLGRWPLLLAGGFCWAGWHAGQVIAMQLPAALEGRDLMVRGLVTAAPEHLSHAHLRLRLRIEAWRSGDDWQPTVLPVRLNWYRESQDVQAGERWQLRVRLKRPHGLANPGGFDYERWLFAKAIRATGYVRRDAANRCLSVSSAPWERLRGRLAKYLQQLDLPAAQRALLRALALGDRAGLSAAQWQLLQHTGTSHLLAISGLHVGLVASLVFLLAERLWRWPGGARLCPAPRVAAAAAMLAALAYALLSGFQVPAQRATIMVWLWMGAILAYGEVRPWPVLALALWITLLRTPLAVLTAGFWLSYAAVALILFVCRGRHGGGRRWRRTLQVQLGLFAGLTPLLWLWFQQLSPLAPLANLIAIPWVGLLVVPPLLLALVLLPLSTPLANALLSLAAMSLHGLGEFLQRLDFGDTAQWPAPPSDGTGLALLTLGLLILLLPAATGIRSLGVLLLLPALTATAPRPATGDVWATLLDVGQGLAVVVETRRHLLVYDTGPAFPGGFDSGSQVVVPFLRQRGYRHLDRLVISHGDNDHSGGGKALLRALPAASVHAGEPVAIPWARAADCRRQPGWHWDGVVFAYLAGSGAASGNNASCVLKVTARDGRSLLLPGDIEQSTEAALLAGRRARLAAQVMVAPHHGSATSSGSDFIGAVNPAWVLFATGYRNRFGFPRPEVTRRYRNAGARSVNTAQAGAVAVHIEAGRAIRVQSWRRRHPRLWRQPD